MFAALHASSSEGDIIAEILTLADSVIQATEALAHYLTPVPTSASAPASAQA
ncbi:DUF2170 family protein [Delftia acidovorans]